jgi:hypothetical protein
MPTQRDVADIIRDEAERQVRWKLSSCLSGCVLQVVVSVILLVVVGLVVLQAVFGYDVAGVVRRIVDPGVEVTVVEEPGGGSVWSGDAPLVCGGNSAMEVRGAQASLPGQVAIVAEQNCSLTLIDVEVTAETAVLARGNARVVIKGDSTLQGDRFAVEALGNSEVVARGVTLLGGVDVKGNAGLVQ